MPIFQLTDTNVFPHPELAEENGLLAVGGDLTIERLLSAYSRGIFPWYSEGEPLLWWFTDPRLVIFPHEFHIPRRLARTLRNTDLRTTFDKDFTAVIKACAKTRIDKNEGTWISPDMQEAYIELHRAGYAHSVECWQNNELAGGLYGIHIGNVFFGESMFTRVSNGSKVALVALMEYVQKQSIQLIDCQMTTSHLQQFRAREINGSKFRSLLRLYIKKSDYRRL